MTERYVLEIYEPGSKRDVLESLSSEVPFAAIAKGDFLNTAALSSSHGMGVIRISGVEHIIWNTEDGPKHKVCVYTETAKDR